MCTQIQQHAVEAEIIRFQWAINAETSVAAGGGFLEWNTEVLRPGRHPGMNSATTEPLLIHTLRCHQAPIAEIALEVYASRVPNNTGASGLAAAGDTVWGPDRIDHAVLLFVPRGALPIIVATARQVWNDIGVSVGIIDGAIALDLQLPEHVAAVIDSLERGHG